MLEGGLQRHSQEDRYRLSGLTRYSTERGETIELMASNASDLLKEHPPLSPIDQADLLLDYLDAHSSPGMSVPMNMDRDYTIAQAQGPKGLQFVVNSLQKDKLIERTDTSAVPKYRLSMAGYQRVKQRRQAMVTGATKSGWEKVDRHLTAAQERLKEARLEEEFQQVGLLCREALISVAQAVFDPQQHPTLDRVPASPTDAKRMLEAIMGAELSGQPNEEARAMAKATVRLALALQHDRAADSRSATLCYEATAAVVRLLMTLLPRKP